MKMQYTNVAFYAGRYPCNLNLSPRVDVQMFLDGSGTLRVREVGCMLSLYSLRPAEKTKRMTAVLFFVRFQRPVKETYIAFSP